MTLRPAWVALAALSLLATGALATAGPFDQYLGGGVVVVRDASQGALLDQGGVVCQKGNALASLGGGCVLFGPWDSLRVQDGAAGSQVAFQVCVDNDGDGLCLGGENATHAPCGDDLFFSHDDSGAFFNPLGPLPQGFRPGCPGGAWPGYVVFLCEGAHRAGGAGSLGPAHVHPATSGSILGTTGGAGFGNFCAVDAGPPKPYLLH